MAENEIETTETTEFDFEISTFFTQAVYSPYGVCKVVNKIIVHMGFVKVLPPQMFYTYASKGMLFNKKNKDLKEITREQAIAWTERYVQKHFS